MLNLTTVPAKIAILLTRSIAINFINLQTQKNSTRQVLSFNLLEKIFQVSRPEGPLHLLDRRQYKGLPGHTELDDASSHGLRSQ